MAKEMMGTCTMCGAENVKVTVVDDEERVCDECLCEEFFFCDVCEEYWLCEATSSYALKNGGTVCEYCVEELDEDEIAD